MPLQMQRDVLPVVAFLSSKGCREENLRLLLWEYPLILAKDANKVSGPNSFIELSSVPCTVQHIAVVAARHSCPCCGAMVHPLAWR